MSSISTWPLISCVMPTTSRRRQFIPQAIKYFLRQDYSNKELLIVDDGADSIADLIPANPAIRYLQLAGQRTLGAKRNLCVEAARGDLIMHWDDDDWFAPHRITYQVTALLREQAEVCGLRRLLFYDPVSSKRWLYSYPDDQRLWLAGGSLLYTRDFWRRAPFPDMQVASDTSFIWGQKVNRAVTLPDYSFYLAIIHSQNTSPKQCAGGYWSQSNADIRQMLDGDSSFYEELAGRSAWVAPGLETPTSGEAKTVDLSSRQVVAAPSEVATYFPLPVSQAPKVSCILATGNRAAFTRQAIRCFVRQTFDDAELIVVDDGQTSVAELCAGLFRVRHIRLEQPTALGQKLNMGIEHSTGSIIQKLDDDDFYARDFLARSVSALEDAQDRRAVVTWDCFNILIGGERMVRRSGHGWTTGGTLCFFRELWRQKPFREVPQQVDTCFIEDHSPRLVRVCAPELYVLVRHGRNTWRNLSSGVDVDAHFRSLPADRMLEHLIEPIDLSFYLSLNQGTTG